MKSLKIIQCRDSLMWYSNMIGQKVELLQVLPKEKLYLSREPAGYTNVVKFSDAVIVEEE